MAFFARVTKQFNGLFPPPKSSVGSDTLQEAQTVFKEIDTNADGELSAEELTTKLYSMGLAEDSVTALFLSLDHDGDQTITEREFCRAYNIYRHYFTSSTQNIPKKGRPSAQ